MDDARWETLSLQWNPTEVQDDSQEYHAHRYPGRPRLRWTDAIQRPVNEAPFFNEHVTSPSIVVVASRSVRYNVARVPFFQPSNDNWW